MDEGVKADLIGKIDIPTKKLHLEVIQEVLQRARIRTKHKDRSDWSEILRILWNHIQTGLRRLDDQLLCAVCFFTVLESSHDKEFYLDKILILIKNEIALKNELKLIKNTKLISKTKTLQVVSLMYGMLQSKCFVQICHKQVPIMVDLLNSTLDLLILMAYEYSRYTFIVFKILSSFIIVCGTELEKVIFHSSKILNLLNLANQNWENPITGVRDLNKIVFQVTLLTCSKDNFTVMLSSLEHSFYWNKAKYLMVALMIEEHCNFAASDNWIKDQSHWIDGLMSSLKKPGLVSAGADMYYAILKKLSTEDEWCSLFLNRIIEILQDTSTKAIDNFCNYWCLTTFKTFPGLSKILSDRLGNLEESKSTMRSLLCVLKQANKLGLVSKPWNKDDYGIVEHNVLNGIDHPDPQIRMLAFEILTVTVGKAMPTSIEYELIIKYLQSNVNSDCTVLRISMLGNMKYFLTNLCASYMVHSKHKEHCETEHVQKFYKDLQEFVIESLNLDGNYQRKITTIKLCHTLLSSLNEVSKKRQKQTTTSGTAMTKFLKEQKCLLLFSENFLLKLFALLKDPADDVRESVVQLLLEHYSRQITGHLLENLIEDAKTSVRSKFFYQISCGQSMFRLISSLLLKENYGDTSFQNIDDVFRFAFDILNAECALKRDIVKSIEDGKQLHAYLSVLQEVLKVAKQFSYEIKSLKSNIPHLLHILEVVSDQFAWEDEPAVSSDFSKMSDMVQRIIASSGYNPLDQKDFSKISGLQQIVLNCLWLNVKASCELASYLITSFVTESEEAACAKCLGVITHVLETSRHKGAIEAAGAALGRAVQQLSSAGEPCALPRARALLQRKLAELLSHAAASVTRRGAGLSIMVHRIVASDMEKGKPLFHYFMETLLQTCSSNVSPESPGDVQKDLPKAVYIHFLTRIVMDSSLASDMMYYSADLAEIAFGNLTSPHWQIRNAALQLYGALVPKLIGQKKASGVDDETVGTVAVDEFRTHSPRLWQHMVSCLRGLDATDTVESHSNVLPIVNVLANLAKRYDFGHDAFPSAEELLESLWVLLGSPIYTVRRLTAKCIFNIYDYDVLHTIASKVMKNDFKGENLLHGCLMLAQHYYKQLCNEKEVEMPVFQQLRLFMSHGNHSYVSKAELEYFSNEEYDIQAILSEAKCNKYLPGVHHWANKRLERYIQSCSWAEIPKMCKIFLEEHDFEKYCEFILNKLTLEEDVPKEIITEIGDILLKYDHKFESCVIWKILYHISLQVECSYVDVGVIEHLQNEVPYRIRHVVPFIASVAAKLPTDSLIRLSNIILSLCDPDTADVEMRYIAALANNQLGKVFPDIPDAVRITAIKCAVLLLQDEDEDVRIINIHFYSNIRREQMTLQPFVCLTKILEKEFLKSCLDDSDSGIAKLCEDLVEIVGTYAKSEDIDEYNPFSNDSKNIYFESEVIKKLIQNVQG